MHQELLQNAEKSVLQIMAIKVKKKAMGGGLNSAIKKLKIKQ